MPNVVFVVDMVRGSWNRATTFSAATTPGRSSPKSVNWWSGSYRHALNVVFVSDHHDPDDLELRGFPVDCVKGTAETQVIPELGDFVNGSNVVTIDTATAASSTPTWPSIWSNGSLTSW